MRKTAGQLAQKALSDTTKYDALEIGHWMSEDIEKHLYEAITNYKNIIDEDEFCVVMVIAKDPLIKNAIRRKFYCWPYLPSPRPNQSVFLYNKKLDKITKRLWVLPADIVMAELAGTEVIVNKRYQTMQAWAVAFFKGTFWEYVRHDQGIDMLSETEYMLKHREELIKAGCKIPDSSFAEPFDFSKIHIKNVIDPVTAMV
ncbi:MAG TPA: hypothetical protein VN457_01615 [Chlamydiales bacterium]|nr:hypothetical protein [Chlamydiales bacterium]